MSRRVFDSLAVSALSAVALITTLVLYRAITQRFDASVTDAFFLAYGTLNLLVVPAYTAISSTLVPVFTSSSARNPDTSSELLGSAVCWSAIVGAVAPVLLALLVTAGMKVSWGPLSEASARWVTYDIWVLGPLVVAQTVGAVFTAATLAAGRYWLPSAAGVCQQAIALAVIWLMPVRDGIALPMAFTLGALCNLCLLVTAWPWKTSPIAPSLHPPKALLQSARLAFPIVLGTIALQLALVGVRFLAARLPPGTVTAFELAYRIALALVEVSASGVLSVVLTEWSMAVAAGHSAALRSSLRTTLAVVLFAILPAPVLLHALRDPALRVWLSSNASDPNLLGATGTALAVFLIGVPLDIAGRLYVRVLVAQQRTIVLGWLALQRLVITLLIAWLLVRPLGLRGLALADTLALGATLVGLHAVTTGAWRLSDALTWRTLFKLLGAAGAAWITARLVAGALPAESPALQCLVAGAVGLAIYLGVAWVLRSAELARLLSIIKTVRGRPVTERVIPHDSQA